MMFLPNILELYIYIYIFPMGMLDSDVKYDFEMIFLRKGLFKEWLHISYIYFGSIYVAIF